MISKQYFEETFSLATAQALQQWANDNLIAQTPGDYAMEVQSNLSSGEYFVETELTDLQVGVETTLKLYIDKMASNNFDVIINAVHSDNSSSIYNDGWNGGVGNRTITFTPTQATMYLAIGDHTASLDTYCVVDNVTVSPGTIANGTFEGNNTTGWYGQNAQTVISVYEYNPVQPPVDDNPYLEVVNIPDYNVSDPEHFLISTNADWSHINDVDKINFYVEPGDYTGIGYISLNASGSSIRRRTISLYNGNDTHPGALAKDTTNLMKAGFTINGSYWTLDRVSLFSGGTTFNPMIRVQGTDNIINRQFTNGLGGSTHITNGGDRTTVQRGRYEDMANSDNVAIELKTWGADLSEIKNCKIILNETRNCNDGIQLVRSPAYSSPEGKYQNINYEGTIIDSNVSYVDENNLYKRENALDFKGGSLNPNNRITVSNNIGFGYTLDKADRQAIGISLSTEMTDYVNNLMYDSARGLNAGSGGQDMLDPRGQKGMIDCTLTGNIFLRCGEGSHQVVHLGGLQNTQMTENLIIDSQVGWAYTDNNDADSTFGNNDIVNTVDNSYAGTNNAAAFNDSMLTQNKFATAAEAGYTEDYVFTKDKYTDNPTVITLPNILKP